MSWSNRNRNDVEMNNRHNGGGRSSNQGNNNNNGNIDWQATCCQGYRAPLWGVGGCCLVVALLLTVILVPISFSYVEWNELAFKKNTVSNVVDRTEVFSMGRYFWGVNTEPLAFPSTYQRITFRGNDLSVFAGGGMNNQTASAGLEFNIECDVYYRLNKENLALIFNDYGTKYHDRFVDAIRASIKNTAPEFTVDDYVNQRQKIAIRMRDEINNDLATFYIKIESNKFLLRLVKFPARVLNKFQDTVMKDIQIDQSILDRDVELYKKGTENQVQTIHANITVINQTAEATARAVVLEAEAASVRIHQEALGAGINSLIRRLNITDPVVKTKIFQLYTVLDNPGSSRVLVGDKNSILNVG